MDLIGSAQNLQPRYNLAPSQLAAVVRTEKSGQRILSMMRFGPLKGEFAGYKPGDWIESFTLITTPPNEVVAPLHNRMPLIIRPRDFNTWPTGEASAKQENLLRTYHSPLRAYPVSTRVNKPENDDAGCIEPLNDLR